VHWVAREQGRSERVIRNWCVQFGIGRQLTGGPWSVSRVALLMFLDGNKRALDAYLSGHRQCDLVAQYYFRAGLADLLELPEFRAGAWGDSQSVA
jgi:hypothetical protein